MTPLGECVRSKLLSMLEPLPSHDLFCPPERVQASILATLKQKGPCSFAELERYTGIAPEYLEDEAIELGGRGYITVERCSRRRMLGKPERYLFFSLTPLGTASERSEQPRENRPLHTGLNQDGNLEIANGTGKASNGYHNKGGSS